MTKRNKKVIPLFLALSVALSVLSIGLFGTGAVKTEHTKYVPGPNVKTYKYYFAMPGAWLNDNTADNDNAPGCYWWDAADSPGDRFDNGWPGYECDKETDEENVRNLYSIQAPQNASIILWNNYLDGGMDKSKPVFNDAHSTGNKNVENYAWGDTVNYSDAFWTFVYKTAADQLGLEIDEADIYDYAYDIDQEAMEHPEKLDFSEVFGLKYGKNFYVDKENKECLAMRFENMVYVVDLNKTTMDYTLVPEGKPQYSGEFYFYYGNGEYGMWPTKNLAVEHEGLEYFAKNSNGSYKEADKYGVVRNSDGQVVIGSFTGSYRTGEITETPDDGSGKIYFEAPSWWRNYKDIRIYIYNMSTNEPVIKYYSKKGIMTDEGNGIWSFDFTGKGYTFNDDQNYCCIFLTDTEMTTLELLIGNPCLGDTAYCPDKNYRAENPADSNKLSYVAAWKKADPAQFAPPLMITSVGNVVGAALPKGVTMEQLLEDFLTESEGNKYLRAITFSGKSSQQLIDDIAQTLGLEVDDVAQAVYNARKAGIDIEWDPEKSPYSPYEPTGDTSGTTGDCEWRYDKDTRTLTISGNGAMEDCGYIEEKDDYVEIPWEDYEEEAETVMIEDGVTHIGKTAFSYFDKVRKIDIPDTVKTIGNDAFMYCANLSELKLPNGLTSIGEFAFYCCEELKSVTIPESVTKIGESALGYYFNYDFDYFDLAKTENFTIYGKKGTEAERYANDNGFIFIASDESETMTGDMNGDGKVNGADAGILSRYTSGWEGYADKINDMKAADINGDGKVNGADSGILNRYTSGWEGYDKYFN